MMNVIALCLVLTTLATASIWSPSPTPENDNIKGDVIVKEGHRTVAVEFEKDDENTKVSISPKDDEKGSYDSSLMGKVSEMVENVKEKLKGEKDEEIGHQHRVTPRELVCDAFGKCKHKIAGAIGKTKEMVTEKAHEVADKVYEVEEEAKEAVSDAFGKVKDTVEQKAHEASDMAYEAKDRVKDATTDKAHEAKERVKDATREVPGKAKEAAERVKDAASDRARDASDKAKEAAERVKDAASDKARDVSGKAKEAVEKMKDAASEVSGKVKERITEKVHEAKEGVKEGVDMSKTLRGDVERNASKEMEEVEEGVERVKEKGKKTTKESLVRGRKTARGVFGYVFSADCVACGAGIMQLLGLATAYGMSVWVTFISSYILARALPRQQFAMMQSKIYPVYFKAMVYGVRMVLLGHLLSQRMKLFSRTVDMLQGFNLVASLCVLLFNLRHLEPRATKVMLERMKLEKEEGRGEETSTEEPSGRVVDSITEPSATKSSSTTSAKTAPTSTPQEKPEDEAATNSEILRLSEELKKLNSYSSFLNILTLMSLTWHLVYLGQRLHTSCR